ncbi:hypothetical protein ES707_07885 [subsurface metagenome]
MEAATVAAEVASAAAEGGIISAAAVHAILAAGTLADIAAASPAIRSGGRTLAARISAEAVLQRVTRILARCGMPRLHQAMPAMP